MPHPHVLDGALNFFVNNWESVDELLELTEWSSPPRKFSTEDIDKIFKAGLVSIFAYIDREIIM